MSGTNKYICEKNANIGNLVNKSTVEGCIYINGKYAFKLYKPNFDYDKMKSEFLFLKENQSCKGTSEQDLLVPVLYSTLGELKEFHGFIMENLVDYITLKEFIKNKKNKEYNYSDNVYKKLLIELAKTRYKIGKNKEFKDLHPGNIMVKVKGGKVFVRVIDPGKIVYRVNGWVESLKDIIRPLSLSSTATGKIISKKSASAQEIKKLFLKARKLN
jgi:hypothetical protein